MTETQSKFAAILRACSPRALKVSQLEEHEDMKEYMQDTNRRQLSSDVYALYRMGFLTRRAKTKGAYYKTTALGQEALGLLTRSN